MLDVELGIGTKYMFDISGGMTIDDAARLSSDVLVLPHDSRPAVPTRQRRASGYCAKPMFIGFGARVDEQSTIIGVDVGVGDVVGGTSFVSKPEEAQIPVTCSPTRPAQKYDTRKV